MLGALAHHRLSQLDNNVVMADNNQLMKQPSKIRAVLAELFLLFLFLMKMMLLLLSIPENFTLSLVNIMSAIAEILWLLYLLLLIPETYL